MATPMRLDSQSTRMQQRTPRADSNLCPVSREHDARLSRGSAIFDFHRFGQDGDRLFFVASGHRGTQRPKEQREFGPCERQHWPVAHEGEWQGDRHRRHADAREKPARTLGAQRTVGRQLDPHRRVPALKAGGEKKTESKSRMKNFQYHEVIEGPSDARTAIRAASGRLHLPRVPPLRSD